jgi:hypothetical protein
MSLGREFKCLIISAAIVAPSRCTNLVVWSEANQSARGGLVCLLFLSVSLSFIASLGIAKTEHSKI